MRAFLMAATATLALAACGGEKTVYSDTEGNEVNVTREGDGDASEIEIKSADGSATVNINSGDAKLPFGLQVYPGAKVVSTMMSNADGKSGGMVIMESTAKPDVVLAWYRKSVEGKGFKIESEITTPDMRAISGTREGGSFTLQVGAAEAGSSITLIAGEG